MWFPRNAVVPLFNYASQRKCALKSTQNLSIPI